MLRRSLTAFREEQRAAEKAMMSNDRNLVFQPPVPASLPEMPILNQVLLTGGTGFIGPFLMKSLLEQTRASYVLVRSSDEDQGRQRLRAAMESMGPCATGLMQMFEARVIPYLRRSGAGKSGPGRLGFSPPMRWTRCSTTAQP